MRQLLAGAMSMLVVILASCQSGTSMADFERLCASVTASADVEQEARRVDELLAYARSRSLRYEVTLVDALAGQPFPIAQLRSHSRPFKVRILVNGRAVTPEWQPRSIANAQKLLME